MGKLSFRAVGAAVTAAVGRCVGAVTGPRYLTTAQAAARLQLSPRAVHRLIRLGKLQAERLQKRRQYQITEANLAEYVRSRL